MIPPRQRIVAKFGKAAGDNDNSCRPSEEDVYLESAQGIVDDEESFWIESIEQSMGLQRPVLKYKAARFEDDVAGADNTTAVAAADASGKYVPPSKRAGATLSAKEGDLTELFSKMGRVHRVFVAKNLETKLCKGFAFVTMASKEMCELAMRELDGHGYDHLILKVEWAKPPVDAKKQ